MDPTTIGLMASTALASGTANVIGGMSTNAANAQAASNSNYINAMEFENSANIQQSEFASAQNFNAGQAQQSRDWAANQAQLQRDYQTQMSNTAYQRAVSGMKAAGLNPILSAGTGGASTPPGAMPSVSTASSPGAGTVSAPGAVTPRFDNVLGAGVSSALQAAKAIGDINESFSRANLNNTQAGNQKVGGSTSSPITTVLNPVKELVGSLFPGVQPGSPNPTAFQGIGQPSAAKDDLKMRLRGWNPSPSANLSSSFDAQSDTAPPNPSVGSAPTRLSGEPDAVPGRPPIPSTAMWSRAELPTQGYLSDPQWLLALRGINTLSH